MRLVIEQGNKVTLEVTSENDDGRYVVRSDRILPRHDRDENPYEITTDDGYHVAGIVMAFFGASDSHMYLRRRLDERVVE